MALANSASRSTSSPGEIAEPPVFEGDWEEIRRRWMLDEHMTHLNHGAFGAVPIEVHRMQQGLRDEVELDPTAWFSKLADRVAEVRQEIAAFLGSDRGDLALVHNASAGASTVLSSFELHEGDEVLSTNHGYGAVTYAIERACRRSGATRREARFDRLASAEAILAAVEAAITERTKLVVIDQITSPTARRLPVEAILATAHERGVAVLVDGAHAPGMYEIDLSRLGADYWVGNLHKWCCAPRSTAALYASPGRHEGLAPLVVSWLEHEGFPRSFDMAGTMDLTAWLAAPLSLGVLDSIGWERLRSHNTSLARYGQQVVADALGINASSLVFDEGVHMAVVPLPEGVATSDQAAVALRQRVTSELMTEVAITCFEGHGLVRMSAQAYNRAGDYERLAVGLRRLLSE